MKNFLWKIPVEIPENIHRSILLNDLSSLRVDLAHLRDESRSDYAETTEKLDYLLRDEIRFTWDFRYAASHYFQIIDRNKTQIPCRFNLIQEKIFERILDKYPIRPYILKSRKFGCSTFILLMYFWDCLTSPNTTSVVVAHKYEASEFLFKIVGIANDNLPDRFRKKSSLDNRREILFNDNSYFFVGSAQKRDSGRSQTINNLHLSEYAYWPDLESLTASLLETTSEEDGNIIIETSPSNGKEFRQFHNDCKGQNGLTFQSIKTPSQVLDDETPTGVQAPVKQVSFDYLFFPWFENDEYHIPVIDPSETEYIESALTGEERLMQESHALSYEQMKFWLTKRMRLKDRVWQEYPPDDLSCFLATGERDFFDARQLHKIYFIIQSIEPIETRNNDQIRIYKRPAFKGTYIIGADTSLGLLTGSRAAAVVIEVESAEEMAELHGIFSPHELGIALAQLGEEYNWALIAVEVNNHGHSTLNTLKNQLFYPNLYSHIDGSHEDWLRKQSGVGRKKKGNNGSLGWPTNAKTRPIMFQDLRNEAIGELALISKSKVFIEECLSIKQKEGEIYSEDRDDTVIARAIVWQVRKRSLQGMTGSITSHIKAQRAKIHDEQLPWEEMRRQSIKPTRHPRSPQADKSIEHDEILSKYQRLLSDEDFAEVPNKDLDLAHQAIIGASPPERVKRTIRAKIRDVKKPAPWEI